MSARPIKILVAALGGEGGGVLADWLVAAAMRGDLPVQSTSIPGVAQRTGATTYYVEIHPETNAALAGSRPLLALYPAPGDVDVMVASELLEAGRAVENGYVTPDRTTLVAATHRVYATIEKMQMADGRFEAARVLRACGEMAQRPILFDLTRSTRTRGHALNAVLFGAIAGARVLPLPRETFEEAIRESGVAVEANLAAFTIGYEIGANGPAAEIAPSLSAPMPRNRSATPEAMLDEAARDFPAAAIPVVEEGIRRLVDYQDVAHARLYLDRLDRLKGLPEAVVLETARQLALWMSYEDVIRVAQLKSRPERLARVRAEVRAKPDEPVHVTEFFKPGLDEISAILPERIGRAVRDWAERRGVLERWHLPMRLTSTGISGYLRLHLLARLRSWRPRSLRYREEQAEIERWLAAIVTTSPLAPGFAAEIARAARLIKGYSDTLRRGRGNFLAIMRNVVEPAVVEGRDATDVTKRAVAAALADPQGKALATAMKPGEAVRLAAE